MKLRNFDELILAYKDNSGWDINYERDIFLSQNPYSIILEGDQMELENLDKFIIQKFGFENLISIIYDKIHYNYHFAEYFFKSNLNALEVEFSIPKIYTTYPNSYPPNKILKSNTFEEIIEYNPDLDENAIIF